MNSFDVYDMIDFRSLFSRNLKVDVWSWIGFEEVSERVSAIPDRRLVLSSLLNLSVLFLIRNYQDRSISINSSKSLCIYKKKNLPIFKYTLSSHFSRNGVVSVILSQRPFVQPISEKNIKVCRQLCWGTKSEICYWPLMGKHHRFC